MEEADGQDEAKQDPEDENNTTKDISNPETEVTEAATKE